MAQLRSTCWPRAPAAWRSPRREARKRAAWRVRRRDWHRQLRHGCVVLAPAVSLRVSLRFFVILWTDVEATHRIPRHRGRVAPLSTGENRITATRTIIQINTNLRDDKCD